MGKPVATMVRANDATRALRGRAQDATRARRHGADALLDQRPAGFDRVEVVRVRRQEPHGGAGVLDRLADGRRFYGRPNCRARRCRRAAAAAPGVAAPRPETAARSWPTSPSPASATRRSAWPPPSSGSSPQFIGRGSISSVPRGSHACDRPIARFAPDSSRNTKPPRIYRGRPGLERRPLVRGRAHDRVPPVAIVFFEHVPQSLQRAQDARAMHARRRRRALVVRPRQFLGRAVGTLVDERLQHARRRSATSSHPLWPADPGRPSCAADAPTAAESRRRPRTEPRRRRTPRRRLRTRAPPAPGAPWDTDLACPQ